MSIDRKVLLLTGTPKKNKGASDFFGMSLLNFFKSRGFNIRKENAYELLYDKQNEKKLLSSISDFDIIIFSSPLYFDSLPSPVVRIMEAIMDFRRRIDKPKPQRIFAISNCGYSEAIHNYTAIRIYRNFAVEVGFKWTGGLMVGMGPLVNIRSFIPITFMLKEMKQLLKDVAIKLMNENYSFDNGLELTLKPFIPIPFYFWGERIVSRFLAAKNGVWNISYKPYT